MFSCEFCEISKNNFFAEHLWTTASVDGILKNSRPENFWNIYNKTSVLENLFLIMLQAVDLLLKRGCLDHILTKDTTWL